MTLLFIHLEANFVFKMKRNNTKPVRGLQTMSDTSFVFLLFFKHLFSDENHNKQSLSKCDWVSVFQKIHFVRGFMYLFRL